MASGAEPPEYPSRARIKTPQLQQQPDYLTAHVMSRGSNRLWPFYCRRTGIVTMIKNFLPHAANNSWKSVLWSSFCGQTSTESGIKCPIFHSLALLHGWFVRQGNKTLPKIYSNKPQNSVDNNCPLTYCLWRSASACKARHMDRDSPGRSYRCSETRGHRKQLTSETFGECHGL